MNKTLAIIMLDFFVMISVAFFILQFVQPDSDLSSEVTNQGSLISISLSIDKKEFVKKAGLEQVALTQLVELGFLVTEGKQVVQADRVRISPSYDGYLIVFPSRADKKLALTFFPTNVLSPKFLQSQTTAKIDAVLSPSQSVEKVVPLVFGDTPVISVDLGAP
ncbi:hypothetical protein [Rhizobiales bacterium]|uniref:hypothetical protein n=1 Tax=Ensifer sp. R-19 TaxID=3404055 RepID=UPI000DE4E90D